MKILTYVLIAAILTPAAAEAQHGKSKNRRKGDGRVITITHSTAKRKDCCWGNRFSLEPYAGGFQDAYDISPDGENTGYLVGFRVGYQLSGRSRLLGNIGYSETNNVADPQGGSSFFVYDNTWVFTTAGAEFDVVPGRTSASIGLQGGAAFRRVDVDGSIGSPLADAQGDDGFSAQEVAIPALLLRHRVTPRATAMIGLQDYIFDFLEGPAKHSLALTAGVAFR